MKSPLQYVHSWPAVAIIGVVSTLVGVIFYFADAEGRADLLAVLCVLGTTAAAIARQAFAVPPPTPPVRTDSGAERESKDEVLADEGPPTKPHKTPSRL